MGPRRSHTLRQTLIKGYGYSPDGKPFARQAWFEESPSPAELTRIDSLVTEIRAAAPEDRETQRVWGVGV